MNDLDIVLEDVYRVKTYFSKGDWSDVTVHQLTLLISRKDFRDAMSATPSCGWYLTKVHEKQKLDEAARAAGFKVFWRDDGAWKASHANGFIPLEGAI